MDSINVLAPAWRDWIETNLNRGCSPESLVKAMISERFDPAFAVEAVNEVTRRQYAGHVSSASGAECFVYDGSRIASGNTIALSDCIVGVSMRLGQPDVVLFDDLLSHEECDELIRLSRNKLTPSMVVDPKTGEFNIIGDRSSHGTYFQRNENEFIARLDRRIAEIMNWPLENGEGIQILQYTVGAEYKAHFDYFDKSDRSAEQMKKGGQRVSTLVMYLNNVERGGETHFPELGLSIAPKRGAALYFAYGNSRGQMDAKTLHAGLPVAKGEKWIATKWMRERPYV